MVSEKRSQQLFRLKSKQAGFGLVEVIVSISIMTMVVIALHYLSRSAYYNWENANNKVEAYNFIQEEIEYIHNLRDTNSMTAGKKWDEGIVSISETPILGNEKYRKTVQVEELNSPLAGTNIKKKIIITVKWQERLGERELTGIIYLTDWKPRY